MFFSEMISARLTRPGALMKSALAAAVIVGMAFAPAFGGGGSGDGFDGHVRQHVAKKPVRQAANKHHAPKHMRVADGGGSGGHGGYDGYVKKSSTGSVQRLAFGGG